MLEENETARSVSADIKTIEDFLEIVDWTEKMVKAAVDESNGNEKVHGLAMMINVETARWLPEAILNWLKDYQAKNYPEDVLEG